MHDPSSLSESQIDDSSGGPVRLASILGSGRHGVVFLGTQETAIGTQRVAIKVPARPGALGREASTIPRFSHPNIVRMLADPLPNGALVLEHCDGGCLADHVGSSSLSTHDLHAIITPIIDALVHIHDSGWIHGDVSPGNIGLRSDAGPILLDFATARPADDSPIDEGTAEFAGPLRQADPRLDVRCLAATTLSALGPPDRWNLRKNQLRSDLMAFIATCDSLATVELTELRLILDGALPDHDRLSNGLGNRIRPTTRTFGPRPPNSDGGELGTSGSTRTSRVLLAAAAAVAVVGVAIGVGEFSAARSTASAAASPPEKIVRQQTAAESVDQNGALWDASTGVLSVRTTEGAVLERLGVGAPGDVAAIADWSCDGQKTLGVYRPSTGAWYEFSSWEPESMSADPAVFERGSAISVRTDGQGCAEPVVHAGLNGALAQ